MNEIDIAIVLGSESDLEVVKASKMLPVLEQVCPTYDLSVISAHRNPEALAEYCTRAFNHGAKVFIGVAGMAAALPGAIAANLNTIERWQPVIGVPLPSLEFPNAQDALHSMVRMPPGLPVAVCGVGLSGLQNAALLACQIVALTSKKVCSKLNSYMNQNAKAPQFGLVVKQGES